MPENGDPIERAFAALREPTTVTDAAVARVRATADVGRTPAFRPGPGRGRAVLVLAGVAVCGAVVAGTVIDRGAHGTFVGEAGARELLRAAASASRGDADAGGWRFSRTTTVDRMVVSGQACETCPEERAVTESRGTRDVWSGPGGETYGRYVRYPTRALENERLLRVGGGLGSKRDTKPFVTLFAWPEAAGKTGEVTGGASLREPGAIGDPALIPSEAEPLVRWVADRLKALRSATYQRLNATRGRRLPVGGGTPGAAAINDGLVDLILSAQVDGSQRAAALDALAERPGVDTVETPKAFRGPDRVTVRINPEPSTRTGTGRLSSRVVIFDRRTHRVVGESIEQPFIATSRRTAKPTISFGGGPRFRMQRGSGVEIHHEAPVGVAGPGLDPNGRRLLDPTRPRKRSGNGADRLQP